MTGPLALLGYVVWYTVRPERDDDSGPLDVTREQLDEWFQDLGLDRTYVPKVNRSIDAFRIATASPGERYVSDDGRTYQLAVVERKRQSDLVVRHVMRQSLDPDAKTIRVAELKFFRARRTTTGQVRGSEDVRTSVHRGLTGIDLKVAKEFVAASLERYEAGRHQMTPHGVRNLLRTYLIDLGAIPIPCAGYFVPTTALTEIRTLQNLVSRVSSRSQMLLLPLVEDDEQRAMLQTAINGDIEERAGRTLANISAWRDGHPGGTPGPRTATSWRDQLRHLQNLVGQYGDQYEMTFPAAADSLEDLGRAVDLMVGKLVASRRRT